MRAPARFAWIAVCLVAAAACDAGPEPGAPGGHAVSMQIDDAGGPSETDAMMLEKKKAAMAAEAEWKQAVSENEAGGPPDARRCWVDDHALGGFDPVSYREGPPRRGLSAFAFEHAGATYVFATAENRDRFAADPEAFVPRYAGWCAMSLALGAFVCPDYENYAIESGELLLFETTVFTNGRTLWNQDPARHRAQADRNFGAGTAR